MRREDREAILRQGVVRPLTPRERRELDGLAQDVRANALRGRPLRLRLRNFTTTVEDYFVSLGGPLPFVIRLREIDALVERHEEELAARWHELAAVADDADGFSRRWRELVAGISFDEVNDLIDRHNRWYPAEARLPMDPRRGDYVLVNGKDYRRRPLDAAWALERFPAELSAAAAP